jgi:uncharacterized protein
MRTKWLVLAGLAAAVMVLAMAVAPSFSTAADTKDKAKAEAPKQPNVPAGPYDPATAKGANAVEFKKMEAALPTEAPAKPAKPRKLLVFVGSTGFYHDAEPIAAAAIKAMGDKLGTWETTFSSEDSIFSAESLAKFDGVFMNNTNGNHITTDEAQKALSEFVKGGKGLMGTHAGGDCNHSWAGYFDLIGGEFDGHVWGVPKASVRNEDPKSPLCSMFPEQGFVAPEEYYTFKTPTEQRPQGYSREKLHILLSIDLETSKLDPSKGHRKDGDYAVSWIGKVGEGRVFYCSMGHLHEHFWSPPMLKHYLAGIQYALGDLKADDTPTAKLKDHKINPGPPMDTPVINPINPGK